MFGDGSQTQILLLRERRRSTGFLALLDSPWTGPMNIGNPEELSMLDAGALVIELSGSDRRSVSSRSRSTIRRRRRPDITLAVDRLGWHPTVPISDGLARTIAWFRHTSGRSERRSLTEGVR